ncbi:MAG: hypothetical protein R3F43_13005 [bacterium]
MNSATTWATPFSPQPAPLAKLHDTSKIRLRRLSSRPTTSVVAPACTLTSSVRAAGPAVIAPQALQHQGVCAGGHLWGMRSSPMAQAPARFTTGSADEKSYEPGL